MDNLQLVKNIVNIFLFVKDKIGKFFFIMDKNQPEIIICRAVIRLAFADPAKCSFYIVIWDTVLSPEIFIIKAKFS